MGIIVMFHEASGTKKIRMGLYCVFLNRKTTQKNIERTGPGILRSSPVRMICTHIQI